MFEVTLKVYQNMIISCCACVQLCILSFYGSYQQIFGSTGSNSVETGFNLGIAGSVFCLISFICNIVIQNAQGNAKAALIFAVGFSQGLGILLLLISSNYTGEYYARTFNVPLCLLFIEICLLVINAITLYVIRKISDQDGNVPGLLIINLDGWPQRGDANTVQAQ